MFKALDLVKKLESLLRLVPDKPEEIYIHTRKNIRKQIDLELNLQSVILELKVLANIDKQLLAKIDQNKLQEEEIRLQDYLKRLEADSRKGLEELNKQLEQLTI